MGCDNSVVCKTVQFPSVGAGDIQATCVYIFNLIKIDGLDDLLIWFFPAVLTLSVSVWHVVSFKEKQNKAFFLELLSK